VTAPKTIGKTIISHDENDSIFEALSSSLSPVDYANAARKTSSAVASASNPGNNTVSANVSGTTEKPSKETSNNGNNHDHQKNDHKNHSETGSKSISVVPPLPALIEKHHPVSATNNQHADNPVPHHPHQQQQHKTPQKDKELFSPPALNFGTLSNEKGIHSGTTTAEKEPALSKPVHHDGPSQRKPESPPPGPILFGSFGGVGAHKNENPHPPHHPGQQNDEAKPIASAAATAEASKSVDSVKRSFLDVSTKIPFLSIRFHCLFTGGASE
jgi:hypothetical protein